MPVIEDRPADGAGVELADGGKIVSKADDGDVDVVGVAANEAADVGSRGADYAAKGVGVAVLGDAGHKAEKGQDVTPAGERVGELFGFEEGRVFGAGRLDNGAAGGDADDLSGAAGLEGEVAGVIGLSPAGGAGDGSGVELGGE